MITMARGAEGDRMVTEYNKSRLSADEQSLYEIILRGVQAREAEIMCGPFEAKRCNAVYFLVINEHPELFFASHTINATTHNYGTYSCCVLEPIYIYDKVRSAEYARKIEDVIAYLLPRTRGKSQREVERTVVNYFIDNVTYELDYTYNQDAAAALVRHKAQCSGISAATKLVFDRLGIECIYVRGTMAEEDETEFEHHAWNIVRIDGVYYHLDVTSLIGCNKPGKKPYHYLGYNAMDAEVVSDHFWDSSTTPKCNTIFVHEEMEDLCNLGRVLSMYQLRRALHDLPLRTGYVVVFGYRSTDSANKVLDDVVKVVRVVLIKRGLCLCYSVSVLDEDVTVEFK